MPWHALEVGAWNVSTWTLLGRGPVIGLLLFLCVGAVRRGASWRQSVLATCALVAGLTAGTAVLPSVIGAIAGGIVAWLAAQRVLGIRKLPLTDLALGLLVVVAVGRVGCLVNGCCFGTVADVPWAVRYDSSSAAWVLHEAMGWIGTDAGHTLPVHPYPLYESLGLVLWLPAFFLLRRRLRSEGALLALTAAWDLSLRCLIDGYRAMVNVWWSLIGHRYSFALAGAALGCIVTAWALEKRARRMFATPVPVCHSSDESTWSGWAVYSFVWVLGFARTVDQTPFLRFLLLCALVAGAAVLRRPAWVSVSGTRRRWLLAPAAIALLLPLALHASAFAQSGADAGPGPASSSQPGPGWQYEVDQQRGALVRIGGAEENEEDIEARRRALGLPPENQQPDAGVPRKGRLWLGAGVASGNTKYSSNDSCGGNYSVYDRKGVNGWGQAEWEEPVAEDTVAWLGGRAGYVTERTAEENFVDSNLVSSRDLRFKTGFAQAWGELEHPNISLGVGAVGFWGDVAESSPGAPWSHRTSVSALPAGHFRGGFSFLGIDLGYADRMSMIGFPASHIGLSGTFYRVDVEGQHPDDSVFRYFVGAQTFPGGDRSRTRFGPSVGLELKLGGQHVFGLDGIVLERGVAGGAHYCIAVGK